MEQYKFKECVSCEKIVVTQGLISHGVSVLIVTYLEKSFGVIPSPAFIFVNELHYSEIKIKLNEMYSDSKPSFKLNSIYPAGAVFQQTYHSVLST